MRIIGKIGQFLKASPGWAAAVLLTIVGVLIFGSQLLNVVLFGRFDPGRLPAVDPETRLRWLMALLPSGMIVQHALFLRFNRRKQIPTSKSMALAKSDRMPRLEFDHSRDVLFSRTSLAVRYWFPAFITAVLIAEGLLFFSAKGAPQDLDARWAAALHAARLGFAGAYFYTVLTLALRGQRRDITQGIAMYSAAALVLGPALSGALAFFTSDAGVASATGAYTWDIVYFAAGLAPRELAGVLQTAALRLVRANAPAAQTRLTPLSDIRGITPELAARLGEEGIQDANALAMADPLQLMRATPFDKRQIVAWIDEAMLALVLPEHWKELEAAGITGAIDLAHASQHAGSMTALAAAIQASDADAAMLKDTAGRLFEDAQVNLLWFLYQYDSEAEPGPQRSTPPQARQQTRRPKRQPKQAQKRQPARRQAPRQAPRRRRHERLREAA